jgi:hypothetical protein
MALTETEPQGSLRDFEYYTFHCASCGDTERRLLPRGKVPITKILRDTTATSPPLRKPYEGIPKKDDYSYERPRHSGPQRAPSADPKGDPDRLNEVLNNPRKFIEMFVRGPREGKRG